MSAASAIVFAVCVGFTVAFQLMLLAGAPWGHLTMGGRYTGKLPNNLRVAAGVQAIFLVGLALVVLARAGLMLPALFEGSHELVWVAVVISAIAAVLNLITPSKAERRLWGPVAACMFVSVLIVALSP